MNTPQPLRRWSLYFLPIIAVFAMLFGAFYLWTGVKVLIGGNLGMGLFLSIFGFGGIALGLAMFRVAKQFLARAKGVESKE